MFRRGMNHKHLQTPKHTSGKDYRAATGFECVLGMHDYLGNDERINELLRNDEKNDTEISIYHSMSLLLHRREQRSLR